MNIISVRCPSCGASLNLEEGRSRYFCQYCGTPIAIDDGSININQHIEQKINYTGDHTSIIRDEAKLKELEIEQLRAELEYKKFEREKKSGIIRAVIRTIIKISWFVCLFLAIGWENISRELRYTYRINMDHDMYDTIHQMLFLMVIIIPIILLVTRKKK